MPSTSRIDLARRLALLADDLGPVLAPPTVRAQLTALCHTGRLALGAAAVSVARLHGDELVYEAADGEGESEIVGTRLPTTRGIAGYVAVTGQGLAVDQVQQDPRFARDVAERTGYMPTSLVVVPVIAEGEDLLGVLSVLDRSSSSADALALAGSLAAQAALVLPMVDAVARLGPVLVEALATTVEAGDADLAAGLRRLAARLPEEGSELASLAALVAELRVAPPATRAAAERVLRELLDLGLAQEAPVSELLPAWAEAFHGDGPGAAPHLQLTRRISRGWAYGDGQGAGVSVAVVDSGIEDGHPRVGRVQRFVAVEKDPTANDGVRFDESPHDDLYGHGTACAGIIRALAPGVELVSVRVLGGNLKGSALAFAHGLDWCIAHGVQVVNLSLSTSNDDYSEPFRDLVDQAAYAGIFLVSAMNNERKRTIPSEFSGVFSVACTPGQDLERFACNPRSPAEWGAPGIDVDVAWSGGGNLVATGNSFAAPVIAGHLARLVGAHPGITLWQAKTVLAQLADNAPGAAPKSRSR